MQPDWLIYTHVWLVVHVHKKKYWNYFNAYSFLSGSLLLRIGLVYG